jgi:hypothetical protein
MLGSVAKVPSPIVACTALAWGAALGRTSRHPLYHRCTPHEQVSYCTRTSARADVCHALRPSCSTSAGRSWCWRRWSTLRLALLATWPAFWRASRTCCTSIPPGRGSCNIASLSGVLYGATSGPHSHGMRRQRARRPVATAAVHLFAWVASAMQWQREHQRQLCVVARCNRPLLWR